jgi:hypothetical protein
MRSEAKSVGESLETIEGAILPSLSHLLDGLLDSAALARPGADADLHATELRYTAIHLDTLGRLLAAVAPIAQPVEAPRRMSA